MDFQFSSICVEDKLKEPVLKFQNGTSLPKHIAEIVKYHHDKQTLTIWTANRDYAGLRLRLRISYKVSDVWKTEDNLDFVINMLDASGFTVQTPSLNATVPGYIEVGYEEELVLEFPPVNKLFNPDKSLDPVLLSHNSKEI